MRGAPGSPPAELRGSPLLPARLCQPARQHAPASPSAPQPAAPTRPPDAASPTAAARAQVRDIGSRREWEAAYSMSVPVLCLLQPGGQEVRRPLRGCTAFTSCACILCR
jgi:hypothetical protein